MADSKCPVCGCRQFHIKNPDDEYDVYEFECREGKVCFDMERDENECPQMTDGTEIYCNGCAWHDKLQKIR